MAQACLVEFVCQPTHAPHYMLSPLSTANSFCHLPVTAKCIKRLLCFRHSHYLLDLVSVSDHSFPVIADHMYTLLSAFGDAKLFIFVCVRHAAETKCASAEDSQSGVTAPSPVC